ncbi:MAG: HAD-IIIA family hydrolase [Acidobacteriota bacterium]
MSDRPQIVVVCGGRGSRLAPSIGALPKILTPLAGRTLLERLVDDLADDFVAAGGADMLLLAGHGGEQVAAAAERLSTPGLHTETLIEERPLGTAGALHAVADRLRERFIFVCGDIVTALDWRRVWQWALQRGGLATLLVHRSTHPEDSDLVRLDDSDRAVGWSRRDDRRRGQGGGLPGALGNAGLAVLHRDLLRRVPTDRPSDLFRDVVPPLVERRAEIHGYRTSEYVRDMGTPERLDAVRGDLAAGRVAPKAELVLLDRDGVLVEEVDWLAAPEQLRLVPGAAHAVARMNAAGMRTALVTNQPVIARGLCTAADMDQIHRRLVALLAAEGARLDGLHVCPHHPETHHGEGVEELRGPCSCRKPATGLVDEALRASDVPAWRTVVVGDRTSDMQLAVNAGLAGLGVETGQGLGDGLCPARPVWTFSDLAAVADWLCGDVAAARRATDAAVAATA